MGMAFFGIAFIVLGSVLPKISAAFYLSAMERSAMVAVLPIGVLMGSLAFGPIVDRFGYKVLLIASAFITALGLLGLSLPVNLHLLRSFIFMIGLGGGILNGATNALVAEISDDRRRGANLSILGACYGVGALLIPTLLGTMEHWFGYEAILGATAVVMLLSILYFAAITFPKPLSAQEVPIKKMFAIARNPLIWIFSLFLFLQSGMEGLFNNWTTTYMTEASVISRSVALFSLTMMVLGMTVMRLLLSVLLKEKNQFSVLFVSIAVVALSMLALFFTASAGLQPVNYYVIMFLVGAGLAAGFPVMISQIGANFTQMTGSAIGFALFIALSGNSLLNYLMGALSKWVGLGFFPLFVIVLLFVQAIIVVLNKRTTNLKN